MILESTAPGNNLQWLLMAHFFILPTSLKLLAMGMNCFYNPIIKTRTCYLVFLRELYKCL